MDGNFNDRLRRRIQERLEELDRGPIEAALIGAASAKSGPIGRDYIREFVTPRKDGSYKKGSLKVSAYSQIAAGLDWTVNELLGEDGVSEPSTFDPLEYDMPAEVPEIDVRGGASYGGGIPKEDLVIDESGTTTVARDAVRATWGIPIPFLRQELRANPNRVHILAVRGDSMNDALFDGDRAVIDLDDCDVSQGGIFALVDDNGSVIIKQVEVVRGKAGRIRCKSRNPHYEPFELVLEDPVKIIGRVACKITRL